MARLKPNDVREILQMLEDGIRLVPKLDKVKKMKIRSKIRKQFNWLSELSSPNADMTFHKLEMKLSDIFYLYPYGYTDKIKKLLEGKLPRIPSK